MSSKLTVAVPRLASTILLIAPNEKHVTSQSQLQPVTGVNASHGNDIQVLMMKRHGGARFMPSMYVFPGGGVEGVDYVAAKRYLATNDLLRLQSEQECDINTAQDFVESCEQLSPEQTEVMAWTCRVAALRELAEEAACVLRKDGSICAESLWLKSHETCDRVCTGDPSTGSALPIYDLSAVSRLRAVARWVSPQHFKYRYDTYFFAALVDSALVGTGAPDAGHSPLPKRASSDGAESAGGAVRLTLPQELPLVEQASEVSELIWVSPLEALRRHEDPSDTFSLAPPTYLVLHGLCLQSSFASIEAAWAASPHSEGDPVRKPFGNLPYLSTLPCVEPLITMTEDGQHIKDFVLPASYLHERDWSLPDGRYRFPGESFSVDRRFIRMFVGCAGITGVDEDTVDDGHTILH